MTASRQRLPQRRFSQTIDIVFRNQPITMTAEFYPDGELGEVFIEVSKSGADIAHIVHDAAVVISLAIQHGVTIETLHHAVGRNGSEPSSIVGAIIDVLPIKSR